MDNGLRRHRPYQRIQGRQLSRADGSSWLVSPEAHAVFSRVNRGRCNELTHAYHATHRALRPTKLEVQRPRSITAPCSANVRQFHIHHPRRAEPLVSAFPSLQVPEICARAVAAADMAHCKRPLRAYLLRDREAPGTWAGELRLEAVVGSRPHSVVLCRKHS